jgi:hypothetical protein
VKPGRGLALLLAVVAGPAAVAFRGARGPCHVVLNLGPGDSPYVRGFAPAYEIEDKVATHWTTPEAAIELPLVVSGGPFELAARLSRPLPETTEAELAFAGRRVDRFSVLRVFQERRVPVGVLPEAPFRLEMRTDGDGVLGLHLDWVSLRGDSGARVTLAGGSRWRAALTVALFFVLLWAAGWGPGAAAGIAAPWAVAATWGLWRDPWLVHRLLTGVPEWLAGLGLVGMAAGRFARSRGLVSSEALRVVTALAAAAFLLRALPLNHPDYYYPDLRSHARLVEVVRQAGLDFLRSPSPYIWDHGVWRKTAYGRSYAFPYSPAFHVPFALAPIGYDRTVTAIKLGAAACSVVPILALWGLARRLEASILGAALLLFVPIYGKHLAVAYVAAMFGHAADTLFLGWLAGHVDGITIPRVFVSAALFTATCELAYVSAVTVLPIFLGALAVAVFLDQRARGAPGAVARPRPLAILGFGLAGSLLALAVYYRDFVGMVLDVLPRMVKDAPGGLGDHAPVVNYFALLVDYNLRLFDVGFLALAIAGFVFLWRRGRGRPFLAAWAASYLLLLLGRARLPDLFQHQHDALFVAPLVCLAAGQAIASLASCGKVLRVLAGTLVTLVAAHGLFLQWKAWAQQLANAR